MEKETGGKYDITISQPQQRMLKDGSPGNKKINIDTFHSNFNSWNVFLQKFA